MAYLNPQRVRSRVWRLAAVQHGVVALFQLLELGYTLSAIKHRVAKGRLHPVRRGVFAVGRPELTREGEWMAAILSCGPESVLSHQSAAALWRIRPERDVAIHVTTPPHADHRQAGLIAHRRHTLREDDVTRCRAIPVTTPVQTLIDVATQLPTPALEAAVNEADKLDLVDPERLRLELQQRKGQPGAPHMRALLDRATFVLTDSQLERYFLPIARRAGLGRPQTQVRLNGFNVDFYWPELGLVVETDGLRYHRTPTQQARDRIRDQHHTAAGLIPLRFTHWQVRHEQRHVQRTLQAVACRAATR
jgi:very-short-patch-repair endonuclease/predicted transcriptional regulator of viral defense system